MRRLVSIVAGLGVFGIAVAVPTAQAADCTDNYQMCVRKAVKKPPKRPREPAADPASSGAKGPASSEAKYRLTLACGSKRVSDPDESDQSDCRFALTACQFRQPPSDEVLYYVWRQNTPGEPWVVVGDSCGTRQAPAGAATPPPVPTLGQIQSAFAALPFGRPRVNIQPEGDVTLVNLPTYYEAQWPEAGLAPGEVSQRVQLLSWSVEFKIAPGTYNFDFGDGTRSGPTKDVGGPYPNGHIRHTYKEATAGANVKVDAQLTGWYRVNGGAWEDIETTADLQDEPVVNLEVREARARLYNN